MTQILAFSNHKGGVGKTTSTINVGACLASLHSKKTLLIDFDPQANLTKSLGIQSPTKTIYGIISGEYDIETINIYDNLDIVPSTINLSGAEIELNSIDNKNFLLKEALKKLSKSSYDYILIDCPPSLGLLTINALTASDSVIVPLQTQFLATQGLSELTEIMNKVKKNLNKKLKLGGIILTQFDGRKTLDRDISSSVEKHFPDKVFKTKIRNSVALAEAPSQGMDIFRYNKKSIGASDYIDITKEILSI